MQFLDLQKKNHNFWTQFILFSTFQVIVLKLEPEIETHRKTEPEIETMTTIIPIIMPSESPTLVPSL